MEFKTLPQWKQGTIKNGMPDRSAFEEGVANWFGSAPPPPVGAEVKAKINGLGFAKVVGYWVEEGFLGIKVEFLDPPEWFRKQNKGDWSGVLFGPEFYPG